MLVNFSDESSAASGNKSNISHDKDKSQVLEKRNDQNVSSSSSSKEEDLTSRQNHPCGSSASSHYRTEEEEFLKKTIGVDLAPEVQDPAKTADKDKMEEDAVIESHPSNLELDLEAK